MIWIGCEMSSLKDKAWARILSRLRRRSAREAYARLRANNPRISQRLFTGEIGPTDPEVYNRPSSSAPESRVSTAEVRAEPSTSAGPSSPRTSAEIRELWRELEPLEEELLESPTPTTELSAATLDPQYDYVPVRPEPSTIAQPLHPSTSSEVSAGPSTLKDPSIQSSSSTSDPDSLKHSRPRLPTPTSGASTAQQSDNGSMDVEPPSSTPISPESLPPAERGEYQNRDAIRGPLRVAPLQAPEPISPESPPLAERGGHQDHQAVPPRPPRLIPLEPQVPRPPPEQPQFPRVQALVSYELVCHSAWYVQIGETTMLCSNCVTDEHSFCLVGRPPNVQEEPWTVFSAGDI